MKAMGCHGWRPVKWLWPIGVAAVFAAALTFDASATPQFGALVNTRGSDESDCNSTAPGGTSAAPIAANIACLGRGAGGAIASATFGHVGASANGLDFGTGGYATEGTAVMAGDVTFTGRDPSAPAGTTHVSLHLDFGGSLSATDEADAEVRGSSFLAGSTLASVLLLDAGGSFTCTSSFHGVNTCGTTACCSAAFAGPIDTDPLLVPLGVPLQLELLLQVSAGGADIDKSGSADFSNSLDFPIGSDVFGLADGVTANSADLNIVDNRFISSSIAAPEPSALSLLGIGLAALSLLVGIRRRSASHPSLRSAVVHFSQRSSR